MFAVRKEMCYKSSESSCVHLQKRGGGGGGLGLGALALHACSISNIALVQNSDTKHVLAYLLHLK